MHNLTRRQLLNQGLTSALLLSLSPGLWAKMQDDTSRTNREFWVSARGDAERGHYFSSLSEQHTLASAAVEFRGHGGSQHPLRPTSAVMYARRHGTQGIEMDLLTGRVVKRFQAPKDHYFYGHGCFSADGKVMFTTEYNQKTKQGLIGVRDADTYQLLGQFNAHGVEPRDLRLMPDGRTLVVANGGILSLIDDDRDDGKLKLNLDTMVTSLSYIDSHTGQLIDDFRLPDPKASIRHLDIADDGTVAIAIQYQREAVSHNNVVPLGAIHKPGKSLTLIEQPQKVLRALNDYVGNVVIHQPSRVAGFSSPRGHLVAFWHIDSGEFKGYHALKDVCGMTVSADQKWFLVTNSFGELRYLDAQTLKEDKSKRLVNRDLQWDNHLITAVI